MIHIFSWTTLENARGNPSLWCFCLAFFFMAASASPFQSGFIPGLLFTSVPSPASSSFCSPSYEQLIFCSRGALMDTLRLEASQPRDIHLFGLSHSRLAKNLCDVHSNFSPLNQIFRPFRKRRMRREVGAPPRKSIRAKFKQYGPYRLRDGKRTAL